MAVHSYFRNISFTTTATDYELLTDTNIQAAIMERLGITDADEYTTKLTTGLIGLQFQIFANATRVSINDESYDYGEFIPPSNPTVFDVGGDYIRIPITSLRIENTGITGTFSFNIL